MTPVDHSGASRASEARLDSLREDARRSGRVDGVGATIVGGPIPQRSSAGPGYYGQPLIKPPVWTWQIGLYLFVGGTAGMSGVIALAGLLSDQPLEFVRAALAIGVAGAVLSPSLLIWDLGRPTRFLNMLRVFKWRSAMSMGVWTLTVFSTCAVSALVAVEALDLVGDAELPLVMLLLVALVLVTLTALSGAVLATYTGVLLGATAVPAWSAHHKLLPLHFGVVALGSAGAILELLGFRLASLNAIGLTVSAVETGIGAWIELNRRGPATRSLHDGMSGLLLRIAGMATGPAALGLRLVGLVPVAAVCFVAGAVISRYGWIFAGKSSALDPRQTLEPQQSPIRNHQRE